MKQVYITNIANSNTQTGTTYDTEWNTSSPCLVSIDELVSIVESCDISDQITWYADFDGDGEGDPNTSVNACEQPENHIESNLDQCPENPTKVEPGICGCDENDEDLDGFEDEDGCPEEDNVRFQQEHSLFLAPVA